MLVNIYRSFALSVYLQIIIVNEGKGKLWYLSIVSPADKYMLKFDT